MARLQHIDSEIDRTNHRIDEDRALLVREHLEALHHQKFDFGDPRIKEDIAVHLSKLYMLQNIERELRDYNLNSMDLRTWDLTKDTQVRDRMMGDLYPVIRDLEQQGVNLKYLSTPSLEKQRELEQSQSYGFGI